MSADSPQEPVVAIIAPSIRPHFWMEMRKTLMETNTTPFMIIFCGHIKPDYELPENFIYIYSEMKAAACMEIAYRHAYSYPNIKYLLNVTDDCILCDNLIDTLLAAIKEEGDRDTVIGAGFSPEIGSPPVPLLYHNHDPQSPALTVFALMKVSTSKKIGSIDKRFMGIYWDCDRIMRLYELGGDVKLINELCITEKPPIHSTPTLCSRFFYSDRAILDSLWTVDQRGGPCSTTRLDEVIPYSDEDLAFTIT